MSREKDSDPHQNVERRWEALRGASLESGKKRKLATVCALMSVKDMLIGTPNRQNCRLVLRKSTFMRNDAKAIHFADCQQPTDAVVH